MKIALCIMVWNELPGLKIDVPNLPIHEFDEVFAVDGGSTDGSVQYLESQNIRVYTQPKSGLNAAYVFANSVSKSDAIVVFFAKGSLPPDDVLKFRPFLESGYDLVIASRQIQGSLNEEDAKLIRPRKWMVLILAHLTALLWKREGNFIKDVLHGFKGWKREAFETMDISDEGLSIDVEMVARAYKLKINRIEFPTRESPRLYGETHFKVIPTGKKIVGYLWQELLRS